MPNDIWQNLREVIAKSIPKDDPKAVEEVYYDVAGFDAWIFDPYDLRTEWAQIPDEIPKPLIAVVQPVVEDNLKAMQEVGEIGPSVDIKTLVLPTTYKLVGYIVDWEKWLPDRRKREAYDLYDNLVEIHEDIYTDDNYGDITNIPDNNVYSGSDMDDIPEGT